MMEKIQTMLERQQEQLFRQHIEAMVKEQLQNLVKQQMSLIAKEAQEKAFKTEQPTVVTPKPSYGDRATFEAQAKAIMDKVNEKPSQPEPAPQQQHGSSDLNRHMEILTSLVKQHMEAIAGKSAVAHANSQAAGNDHGHSHPHTAASEEQGVKEEAPAVPAWPLVSPAQRRFFYDDEHGDIRRMVMPMDEEEQAQRAYIRQFKNVLVRRPRDTEHAEPRVDVAPVSVPILVMPPGEGESQPRLALLASPMPHYQ